MEEALKQNWWKHWATIAMRYPPLKELRVLTTAITNNKLLLIDNDNWDDFAQKTIEASTLVRDITNEFYEHFYWGYSTQKAAEFIKRNA